MHMHMHMHMHMYITYKSSFTLQPSAFLSLQRNQVSMLIQFVACRERYFLFSL
jgi:hypothetical protein